MWSNFHTHCDYCDGKGSLESYVRKAKELGMIALGLSSHAPLPFPRNWCMRQGRLQNYLTEINALALAHSSMEIYKGLEVDFIPDLIGPRDFSDLLDYTIGSVHFVDQVDNENRWEIDSTHLHFLEGLEAIFKNDIRQAVGRYFELTREMITNSTPSIVGHIDKIKIQNLDNKFFRESDKWYRYTVKKTLALIKETGAIVEVNTRGLYQKKSVTTYPSPWILEEVHKLGIPVIISSDAHHPKDLIAEFGLTAQLLMRIGFRKLSVLSGGKWTQVDFNENGILI